MVIRFILVVLRSSLPFGKLRVGISPAGSNDHLSTAKPAAPGTPTTARTTAQLPLPLASLRQAQGRSWPVRMTGVKGLVRRRVAINPAINDQLRAVVCENEQLRDRALSRWPISRRFLMRILLTGEWLSLILRMRKTESGVGEQTSL